MLLHEFALRVLLALALGTVIGAEREWRHKLAGLKTNALVCVGAALFTTLGFGFGEHTDPSRVAAQIASGIGFLGAGAILRDGMNIRGLTTAATIWCAAGVGCLCGTGMFAQAVIGTTCILCANVILKECARIFIPRGGVESLSGQSVSLTFSTPETDAGALRRPIVGFLERRHLVIKSIHLDPIPGGLLTWRLTLASSGSTAIDNAEQLCEEIFSEFGINAGWFIV